MSKLTGDIATLDAEKDVKEDAEVSKGALTKAERLQDLKDRLEALKEMMGKYEDPVPSHDCVVWNDGEKWVASVDVDESGDMSGGFARAERG